MERRWCIRKVNEAYLERLERELSIPRAAARILLNRGITTPEEGRRFLDPSLDVLDDLLNLPGVLEAVSCVAGALRKGSHILVFGDYDVDGLTASAMLFRFLRRYTEKVTVYIPSRFVEGYGLTPKALHRILSEQRAPLLVITVDCGIRDVEGARILKDRGAQLVILDHHFPDPLRRPEADAIVSTWDHGGMLSFLSGAGLALLFVRALAFHLGVPEDPAETYLDFACLGTIGDAVPLLRENRAIAKRGLEALRRNPSVPLQALCAASGIGERAISAEDVGFILAPRMNAAGRVGHPKDALDLLLCDHPEEAFAIARRLNALNSQRQKEEERVLRDIQEDPEKQALLEDAVVVLSGKGWNIGVLGIVASRLSESYARPVIVLGEQDDGVAVGSGRSVEGFNLLGALEECASLLLRYGGHEMAVGLKLRVEHIPSLRKRLNEHCAQSLRGRMAPDVLVVDALVDFCDLNERFFSFWERLKPFGEKNPNPLLAALNVVFERQWTRDWKGNGLRLLLRQGRDYQEAVIFEEQKGRAGEFSGGCLADFAFEVRREYLKVHDWRIKK